MSKIIYFPHIYLYFSLEFRISKNYSWQLNLIQVYAELLDLEWE